MTTIPKIKMSKHLLGTLCGFLAAKSIDWSHHFQMFPKREVIEEREIFRKHTDAFFDLQRIRANRYAIDEHLAFSGGKKPG